MNIHSLTKNGTKKIKKKMENKVIIYDIRALPQGITLEDVIEIYAATGIIMYDSMAIANVPIAVDVNNLDETVIVELDLNKVNETTIQINRP